MEDASYFSRMYILPEQLVVQKGPHRDASQGHHQDSNDIIYALHRLPLYSGQFTLHTYGTRWPGLAGGARCRCRNCGVFPHRADRKALSLIRQNFPTQSRRVSRCFASSHPHTHLLPVQLSHANHPPDFRSPVSKMRGKRSKQYRKLMEQ